MPKIADYIVVTDNLFELASGETKNLGNFRVPSDLVPGTGRSMAILQYKIRPISNQQLGGLTDLVVKVNGHQIETVGVSVDTVRGLWETFPADILNEGTRINSVEFRSNSGPARISDVILWFQRDI